MQRASVGRVHAAFGAIGSFGDEGTAALFAPEGDPAYRSALKKLRKQLPEACWPVARRKLSRMAAATCLLDLQGPRGNNLEALRGEWKGHFSVRINEQHRIVFRYQGGQFLGVRVLDYHKG